MVETFPYEALSHAALAWLEANLARCDVVHVHEWGGVFVDVITAAAYRQLKPGEARVQVYRGCLLPSVQVLPGCSSSAVSTLRDLLLRQ